jgi:hypothetical protein
LARWANSEAAFWSVRSRCALQLCTAGDDADDLDAEEAETGAGRLGVTGARDAGDADGTGGWAAVVATGAATGVDTAPRAALHMPPPPNESEDDLKEDDGVDEAAALSAAAYSCLIRISSLGSHSSISFWDDDDILETDEDEDVVAAEYGT